MAKKPSKEDLQETVGASMADIFGTPAAQRDDSGVRRRRSKSGSTRDHAAKYGKTPPWRLPPDLIEAVRVAADEHRVRPKDLVEYVLRVSLVGMANGKLHLPFDEESTRRSVAPGPDIPDAYVE